MKTKTKILSWLALMPVVVLCFAFKAYEPSARVDVKDKTLVVYYVLNGATHVDVNIVDKMAKPIEVVESTDDIEGSYKVTYKLTKSYQDGEHSINVLFDGKLMCSKKLLVQTTGSISAAAVKKH